jgi:hypothetical protein
LNAGGGEATGQGAGRVPWTRALLALGVALRLAEYLSDRGYWLDESSLARNITRGSTLALTGRLGGTQIAPPFFLLAERLVARVLGDSHWALRLIPLAGGIASLFLFRAVSRRVLTPRAALIGLAMFAISDELIYYAIELKPYGCDVAASLAVILAGLELRRRPATPRRLAGFAALGAVLVGFSFPAVFVLAAVGSVLAAGAIHARRWRRLAGLAAVGAAWSASFALAMAGSRSQIGPSRDLWVFWGFAFPPPLRADPAWMPRRLLFLFVNPLDFHGPFDPRISALPAIACAAAGLAWLVRRRPAEAAMLFGPIVPGLAAAALRLYPFHGRLVMHLMAPLLLAVAAGADRIWAWSGRRVVGVVLLVALLGNSAWLDLYHLGYAGRGRSGLNPRGDRRPGWLHPEAFGTPGPLRGESANNPSAPRVAGRQG